MASVGSGDGEPEFQIAPMIDVLLVLLVFFVLITSAQVLKIDQSLKLPVSPNAVVRDPEMVKHEMAVNVRYDPATNKGVLVLDDHVIENWEEVVPILEAKRKADDKFRVVLRGDKDLPANEVMRIMSFLGNAGIYNISFSASNK